VTYASGDDVPLPDGMRVHRARALGAARTVPIGPSFVKLPLDLLLYRRALEVLRERGAERIDLLHGFEEGAWIAAALGARHRKPFVYDMDSDLAEQMRDSGRWIFRRLAPAVAAVDGLALRRAAAILTVCETLSERARQVAPGVPIFQIEDAPNVDVAAEPSLARATIAEQWRLPAGELVVYTGNLEPYQGVPMLVRAAAIVLREHPSAVFVFVGGDPPRIAELRALARSAPHAERIVFTGARPEAEMPLYLAAADVLVSPRALGCNAPLKLYSYLMAGKPIVATDRRVHTQILSADEAVLAEPTAEGLARGILSLLRSPQRRAELGLRARLLAETRYSAEAFRAKARVFAAAIEGRTASGS
jgi:glycosyltransferase involved in cell wall biosynthesis